MRQQLGSDQIMLLKHSCNSIRVLVLWGERTVGPKQGRLRCSNETLEYRGEVFHVSDIGFRHSTDSTADISA